MSRSIEDMLKNHETNIDPDVTITLIDEELWETFFNITNEMVCFGAGTAMCPELKITVEGLKNSVYAMILEFRPVSQNRWRFTNGKWTQETSGDSLKYAGYMHQGEFQNADSWTGSPITFRDLRITTNENAIAALSAIDQQNTIVLKLLHKYVPVIRIFKLGGMFTLVGEKELYTCAFIVVHGYKNDLMIQLKGNNEVTTPKEAPVVILTQSYADFPKNYLNHPDTPYSQTRPVGLMINNLQNYQPPLKEEQLRNLTPFTTTRLFPPNKLSFVNFLDLYTIKTMFDKNDYTLNRYVEDIKNKNFSLPNTALLYRKTRISDTKVVFTTRNDIEFVVNTRKPVNPYATPMPRFNYPIILSGGVSTFQQSLSDYQSSNPSNVSGISSNYNLQSVPSEAHSGSSFANTSSLQSSSEPKVDVTDVDSLESTISVMVKDIRDNIPDFDSKVSEVDNMIQSYLEIKDQVPLDDLTFLSLADSFDSIPPDVQHN